MKLFIAGARGQVGLELQRQAMALGWPIVAVDRETLDITDTASVAVRIRDCSPDVVINAAAYTTVDKAESEANRAFAVNRDGAANLATACAEFGIPMVHYSTDYVFDGAKVGGYAENDPTAPLGVYGASKLAGELAVRRQCRSHLILRTSWVFSAQGHNFVKTMLRLGAERDELCLVSDQYGKPTSASELVRLTLGILPKAEAHWGTYHVAQPDATNWYGFAKAIFTEARRQGAALQVSRVQPIMTSEYPLPAKRPANSELNCDLVTSTFGLSIRPWRDSLAQVIEELRDE